jgi:hypothetical protein
MWARVLACALAVTAIACARGADPDIAPSQRDGSAGAGEGGTDTVPTNETSGSDPVGSTGGTGEAGSAAGAGGSAGADMIDSAAMDPPETGTDASSSPDVAPEASAPETGVIDASPDVVVIGPDITAMGTIVAFMPTPIGGGNKNLEVIRDGVTPPVNSTDSAQQFDTFHNDPNRTEDWIGYTFASSTTFVRLVFQDGKRFVDGGWFTNLKVQVRQANVWVDVPGMTSSPPYAGMSSPNFSTYTLDFPPITGDGIRIDGAPGGTMKFISVGELRVFRAGP